MGSITRTALVLACSAALAGGMAVPASAADTADTATTVNITAGLLSLTVPASAALSTGTPGANSTVTLGPTMVTDARAGTTGWSATVTLPALTGPAGTIPTTGATYLAATVTPTGTSTLAVPALRTDLTSAKASQTATDVSGNNTATWTADLVVPIPPQVLVGDYTAQLTQSVI